MHVIYTIPGLGTTKELFKNISVPNFQVKVMEWPEPKTGWNLKDYAREFVEQIDTTSPVNLMGVSFGGMLCAEIADMIPVNKIVLISSCKNRTELPANIRILKTLPVQKLVTDSLYRSLASKLNWIVGFEKDYLPEFLRMLEQMPKNYFKYCVDMIIHWDKKSNTQKIYHIHGNADNLLSHTSIKEYQLIEHGNHAMIVYKAQEINSLLNTYFNGL
ncbi:hypothetical protein CNR22_10370 [Sphingobacteriaceae bacterium]|nr:hypothetical protein CNR22_10370 [Sphingobacteriaceae bacterium]